jgi:hypothetical protein
VDNSFTSGGTDCVIAPHCIESDVAGRDYCAQCSYPGEEVCSANNERMRCSEAFLLETIEQCVDACLVNGSTSICE